MAMKTATFLLCMGLSLAQAGAAAAQCYPGLACPDPGGPTKPDGGGGNARSETAGRGGRTQVEYYFVGPVNPPDDWLSLRTSPSDKLGSRIMKMPQGTLFRVTEKRGDWWFVQLRDGKSGWAHSLWIRCCKYFDE